jgi:hypothetical protein
MGYPSYVARSPKPDNTACPNCGHSPIAEADERCPKCFNWIRELPRFHANRVEIHNDAEQEHVDAFQGTRIGGPDLITSAAEAYPGLSSALLVALGLSLGLVGLGLVPASGSPHAYLGLATFDLLCGIFLFAYPALARPPVALTVPLQMAALLYIGRAEWRLPEVLAVILVPVAVLAGTSGEPGPKLRGLAFCTGLGLLVYSGVVRFGVRAAGVAGALIDAPEVGFRAQLPAGFARLGGPADLADYLVLGGLDGQMVLFPFGDPGRRLGGLWGLAAAGRYQPGRLAQGFAEALEAPSAGAKPVGIELGLKVPTTTFERGLGASRTASVTAFKLPDDRVAVLVVAGASGEVAAARSELVRGASFAPPAAR